MSEYRRHGPAIAKIVVHADGTAVMSLVFEVPAPNVGEMVQRFLEEQERRQKRPTATKAKLDFVEQV